MARRGRAVIAASRLVAHLAVGGAFLYAGWGKARAPGEFIRDVWNYRILPEPLAYWIAAYLPYLEILAGAALITGFQRTGARLVLGLLLAVFCVLLTSAWARGLDIRCGCFGGTSTDPANYPLLLARNALLLAALAWSAVSERLRAPLA